MTLARVRTVALLGVDAHPVEVEATTASGPPGLYLDGLPSLARAEVRDRVRAAITNSAHDLPTGHMTVRLLPMSLPKRGSGCDLPIAIAILAANGALPADACADMVMIGELGLDGRVRPTPGVLPAVSAAADAGADTVVVPHANAAEASLVPGMKVIAAGTLDQLVARLRSRIPAKSPTPTRPRTPRAAAARSGTVPVPGARVDLAGIGDAEARRAVEISAAGGHSIALMGAPESGTRRLAEWLLTLIPDLDHEAALEATAIHSVYGALPPGHPLITRPPLCAPHPTISRAALLGGGSGRLVIPGAMSLAHRGVLFLDHATEVADGVLDALPTVMDTGQVAISRGGATGRFPARFTLVLAADRCSCRASTPHECVCTPAELRRHRARLSGRLLDRIEIKHRLAEPTAHHPHERLQPAETHQAVVDRVQEARERARHRLAGLPWRTNAEIPGRELDRRFAPPPEALDPIIQAIADGRLSDRGADRVIRTAWTLTDLAKADQPTAEQVSAAFGLWDGLTSRREGP